MKAYRVVHGPVTIEIGRRLRLSEDQIARRAHLLERDKGGAVVVRHPTQFKAGEVIAIEGAVSRAFEAITEPVSKARGQPQSSSGGPAGQEGAGRNEADAGPNPGGGPASQDDAGGKESGSPQDQGGA